MHIWYYKDFEWKKNPLIVAFFTFREQHNWLQAKCNYWDLKSEASSWATCAHLFHMFKIWGVIKVPVHLAAEIDNGKVVNFSSLAYLAQSIVVWTEVLLQLFPENCVKGWGRTTENQMGQKWIVFLLHSIGATGWSDGVLGLKQAYLQKHAAWLQGSYLLKSKHFSFIEQSLTSHMISMLVSDNILNNGFVCMKLDIKCHLRLFICSSIEMQKTGGCLASTFAYHWPAPLCSTHWWHVRCSTAGMAASG